ncbi:MAG: UDP-glucose 4-epimerase GalE [Chlamydiia bacterium]|nr:UDP-glucose 4-epimerase GalE [Chlamydiia bacterium]
MKRVLVTGGAGYIGSHVCKALYQNGYEPLTLDNLSLGHESSVKWGPFFHGNCGDQKLLDTLLSSTPVLGVIHLAARSNVRESHQVPLEYFQNNVVETLHLLEVLQKHRVPHFVFSSTCSIYGLPQKIPLEETHPKSPINTYGTSKWMVEQILQSASQSFSLKVATLRYFNAAGADPDGEIGESHDPETHLIPLLIQTALGKQLTFTLYGEDHNTPDGTPIRDFIHVTDLAQAHVKALEQLMETGDNLTLNLGTGKGYSVKEVIETLQQGWGVNIPLIKGERFPGDPPILVADPSKAQDALGWTPEYSDLQTILETAWNWHHRTVS